MQDRMNNNNKPKSEDNNSTTTINSSEEDEEMKSKSQLLLPNSKNNNNHQNDSSSSSDDDDSDQENDEDEDDDDFEIQTKIYRNKCQQFVAVNFIGIAFLASFIVALMQGYAFVSSTEKCEMLLAGICGINIFMLPLTLYVRPCMIPIDNVLLLFVEFSTFVGSMLALFVPPPPPFTADINAAEKILKSDEYDRSYKMYMITQLSLTSAGLFVSFLLITVGILRFAMLIVSHAKVISVGLYRKRVAQEIAFLNIFQKVNEEEKKKQSAFIEEEDEENGMEADEIMF